MSVVKVAAASMPLLTPHPVMFGNEQDPTKVEDLRRLGWSMPNWLSSRLHFSFAEYSNPARNNFGCLRALNDDTVQPLRGFAEHPQSNMEVVTYIVTGEFTITDIRGNTDTLSRGDVYYVNAGRGTCFAGMNRSKKEPCRLLQIWFVPPTPPNMLPPSRCETIRGDSANDINRWVLLGSNNAYPDVELRHAAVIDQDVNIYKAEIDPNKGLFFELHPGRQAYCVCAEGAIELGHDVCTSNNWKTLKNGDAAQIYGSASGSTGKISYYFRGLSDYHLGLGQSCTMTKRSHVLLVEMALT